MTFELKQTLFPRRFFICLDEDLLPFRCPSGLHWNQEQKQCDYIEKANCVLAESFKVARTIESAPK